MKATNLKKLIGVAEPPEAPSVWMSHPFTVIDLQDEVWTAVTDRAWFVAVQGKSKFAQCKAEHGQLHTVMTLLGTNPKKTETVTVEKALSYGDKVSVAGVPVDGGRLGKILELTQDETVEVWNASEKVGIPCLGIRGTKWKALLAGVKNAEGIPKFSAESNEKSLYDIAMEMD